LRRPLKENPTKERCAESRERCDGPDDIDDADKRCKPTKREHVAAERHIDARSTNTTPIHPEEKLTKTVGYQPRSVGYRPYMLHQMLHPAPLHPSF